MNAATVSAVIIIVLLAAVGIMAVQFYGGKGTGQVTASASSGSYDGYSSYEEMMAAHHGGGSSASSSSGHSHGDSGGECGMEAPITATNGAMSDYGVTYDATGYQQLIGYDTITLTSTQTQTIVGLNVQIPCCGFTTLQASGNCQCGHHVALSGLAKLLVTKGYSRDQIQSEIEKWKVVFYPNGAQGAGAC